MMTKCRGALRDGEKVLIIEKFDRAIA